VVVNNGSDGPTSHMWVQGGAAAAVRGYHWMTFDGPGQQAARFKEADGAGRHCEPLAPAQRDSRVFDWLDGYLG
jgi:hypothetical protein